jgi:hypothetical protein
MKYFRESQHVKSPESDNIFVSLKKSLKCIRYFPHLNNMQKALQVSCVIHVPRGRTQEGGGAVQPNEGLQRGEEPGQAARIPPPSAGAAALGNTTHTRDGKGRNCTKCTITTQLQKLQHWATQLILEMVR